MNHCNPDSSTKTHISSPISHTKHVFSITLFYRKFTYPLTQNMPSFTMVHISSHQNMPFFKCSSTENSHIFPHKPCLLSKTLPQNIHIYSHTKHVVSISLQTILSSSHRKHVFLHAFFHKESHILSPNPCPFSMARPHKIQFTYLPTLSMPCFKDSSTENSHIQHMSFYMSSFNETKAAYVKELPRKGNLV